LQWIHIVNVVPQNRAFIRGCDQSLNWFMPLSKQPRQDILGSSLWIAFPFSRVIRRKPVDPSTTHRHDSKPAASPPGLSNAEVMPAIKFNDGPPCCVSRVANRLIPKHLRPD